MERKLIKQGDNALTVTLPAKWLAQRGLKAGDTVSINEESTQITISTARKTGVREIEVDLRGLERSAAFQKVISVYIEGHDLIVVNHSSAALIVDISKELMGMIIEKQTGSQSVLRNLIVVPEDNVEKILQRIRFMLLEQGRLLLLVATGKGTIVELRASEKLLDQNILYCLRYICKYERSLEGYRLFSLCLTFDLIGDKITEIGKYIGKNAKLASLIVDAIESYTSLAFKGDLEGLNRSLRSFRDAIGTKTFVEGLTYSLAETMYNFVGYLMEKR
ncbi:hypothetical protein HYV86_01620 [Candidatus Woesearchaeota archaeon]|nr:hypothetical protein [Candidatus Woesearchaeota archaeon]